MHYTFGPKGKVADIAASETTRFVVAVSLWRVYADCRRRVSALPATSHLTVQGLDLVPSEEG
jgi:hypothetical protein